MIFDTSRGWAWTQAIVGVPANEVIIICSAYAAEAIENLLKLCGENCKVHHVRAQAARGADARPGAHRRAEEGRRRRRVQPPRGADAARPGGRQRPSVSVIYGALPPEVRRREAERFAHGHAHILVATDAIGMGLNLPIRRVLFSTLKKFDGVGDRLLNESEVHQIAGRAGRYGMHEEGFTGVLREAEPTALRTLKELLPKPPRAPRDFKATVAPNWWHVDTIATRLHLTQAARGAGRVRRPAQAGQRPLRRRRARPDAGARRAARSHRRQADAQAALHLRPGAGRHAHRGAGAGLPRLDAPATPPSARPARPGSSTRSTSTAASTTWRRRCARARCGCGSTCASPASTATSTR